MSWSKVSIIFAQVAFLCACAGNNGASEPSFDASALGEDETNCATNDQVLRQVCVLTNNERRVHGLPPLTLEPLRSQAAQDHADDMATRGFFSHTNPDGDTAFDRLANHGVSYQYAAENIAVGQSSAQQVVLAWMNSSGHRANILNVRYTKLGVGRSNGHWVQVFTD